METFSLAGLDCQLEGHPPPRSLLMHYGEAIIFIVYKTSSWTLLTYIVGCFHLKFIVNSVRLACMQLDE